MQDPHDRKPNPYQPPGRHFSPKPLRQRLRIATRRAFDEYRAGMRRDGLGVWEHVRLLFLLAVLTSLVGFVVLMAVGDLLGWF